MSDHRCKTFELELEDLRTRVLQMGGLAEEQVRKAVEGLDTGDHPLLETVIRNDVLINEIEIDTETSCYQIIAKRQPTANDLRMIVSVLKAISDLERVGDKARKIARLGIALTNHPAAGAVDIEVNQIADTALKMLRLSREGFAPLDVRMAP